MKRILNVILAVLILITIATMINESSKSSVNEKVLIDKNQYAARVPVPVTKPPQ